MQMISSLSLCITIIVLPNNFLWFLHQATFPLFHPRVILFIWCVDQRICLFILFNVFFHPETQIRKTNQVNQASFSFGRMYKLALPKRIIDSFQTLIVSGNIKSHCNMVVYNSYIHLLFELILQYAPKYFGRRVLLPLYHILCYIYIIHAGETIGDISAELTYIYRLKCMLRSKQTSQRISPIVLKTTNFL